MPNRVLELVGEALDECEGRVGHVAPAVVDDERVTTIGNLDELGHALVALLLLVGGIGNRRGDGVILGSFDDQERPAVDPGTAKVSYSFLASSSPTTLAKP